MIQAIWQGVGEGVVTLAFLLLNPIVAFFLCLALVVVAVSLRDGKGWHAGTATLLSVILGCYAAFNVADYCIYRSCGALAISPINQKFFHLFFSPDDLYVPYAKVALHPDKTEYEMGFHHKYAGRQVVCLGVVNPNPKEFDYDDPDFIGLSFDGSLGSESGGSSVGFQKSFDKHFLLPGENRMDLFGYQVDSRSGLRMGNRLVIKVEGDIAAFLRRYPGSYLAVKNATVK